MKTKRLVLTPFTLEDIDFLFQLNNSPVVNKYRPRQSDSIENCKKSIEDWNATYSGFFNVYCVKALEKIGMIFLAERDGEVELGYRFLDKHWHKGYAFEAADHLINELYTNTDHKVVCADTHSENEGSIKLLEKLGFVEVPSGHDGKKFRLTKETFLDRQDLYKTIYHMQGDQERSKLTDKIKVKHKKDMLLVNNIPSTSPYSTKVVYVHPNENEENLYQEAEHFFDKKPYSWFVRSHDTNLNNLLLKEEWSIHDIYEGLYYKVDQHYDIKYDIKVVEDDNDMIQDLCEVIAEIWSVPKDQWPYAKEQYRSYINSSDKRGGYILAYCNKEVVGYGNYRFSEDRNYIYLAGTGVKLSHRGKGIYKSLLNYRLNIAYEHHAKYVVTQARQTTSYPILKRIGFKRSEQFTHYIKK